MPIYTKKGDKGETGLFDGKRVSKDDLQIEAIGLIDELNCAIGLVIKNKNLQEIQSELFELGGSLAGAESKVDWEKRIKFFEQEIDQMWKEMPPLSNFILPQGQLHFARAVCRRAERAVIKSMKSINSIKKQGQIIKYLNRLSDYLFCLARWRNFKDGVKETVWKS